MKAIVLLSGGLDSAVAGAMARSMLGNQCFAICFHYGQRHSREIEASKALAEVFDWPWKLIKLEIPAWSALTDVSAEVNMTIKKLPASFVPGRNLIFLSYATAYAWQMGVGSVVGGWNYIDYSGYPDCRPGFIASMQQSMNLALGYEEPALAVYAPLLHLPKKEIILLGRDLDVPFYKTWSCYEGKEKPCGVCGSCKFRAKGFEEAGMKDPLVEV